MDKTKLRVSRNEITIEDGEDSFIGKLIAGAKGKVRIKTPFGDREITKVYKASERKKIVEEEPELKSKAKPKAKAKAKR
ncbi:MAG: hypothetical protein SVK08_00535 [Halobacteriota archaeon]|nr:hypothetical protein [Halobacteriota archaeon]